MDGGIRSTAFAIAWSTARPPEPRPWARPSVRDLVELSVDVLGEQLAHVHGVAPELAVRNGPFLKRSEGLHPLVRVAEETQPEEAHHDDQQGSPHEGDEQLCVDPGGYPADRPDERVVGRAYKPPCLLLCCSLLRHLTFRQVLGLQLGSPSDHLGDQPATVDPRNVHVRCSDRRDLVCIDVDEVALEVQRAAVSVDRTRSLNAGWSESQFVRGSYAFDFSHTFRIWPVPVAVCPGPNVNVAFGAQRRIIMSMSFLLSALWKSLSIWLIA